MRLAALHNFFRRLYRYRSIRLTSDGTRFVLLTFAVGVAATNTGNNLLYLLLAMMLSLVVLSGILSEQSLRLLDLRRQIPGHVFANRPATAALSITNRKTQFPSFSLRVSDVVGGQALDRGIHLLHLAAGTTTIQAYPLLIPRRGLYRIDGVKLQTRFPFGLFDKAATLPLPSEVVAYPELQPLPEHVTKDLAALGQALPLPKRGQGSALHSLREYQPGDDSRTIHWKTSARQGRLIIREMEAEDQRRVTLALPTRLPDDIAREEQPEVIEQAFEQAVVLVASLAAYLARRGYTCRLLVGEDETAFGSGEAHLHDMLRLLALCQPVSARVAPLIPRHFRNLNAGGWQGELNLVVLPWADPEFMAAAQGTSPMTQRGALSS